MAATTPSESESPPAASSGEELVERRGLDASGVAAVALVVIVPLVVFGQVVRADLLHWDDYTHIVKNPHINTPGQQDLARLWERPYFDHYVPLSYTLFALETRLAARTLPSGGLAIDPRVYHLGSLVLHIGCALLAFALLKRLAGNVWAACAGALVFALHPLQTESVAWVSETRGLLCGLFSLLAIWQYAGFADRREGHKRGRAARLAQYVVASLAFALALLSKPSAVAVPVMLAALAPLVLRQSLARTAATLAPWVALAIPVIIVNRLAQVDETIALTAPLWARPLIAGDALAFYLAKLFVPLGLAPDYGRTPGFVLDHWWGYLTWLVPLAGLALLVWLKDRTWLACGLIFAAALLPVLGLVPFAFQKYSTVADRYAYLALLGPALAVSVALARRPSLGMVAAVCLLVTALGVLSFRQTPLWRNDVRLFHYAVRANPDSYMFQSNLGGRLNDLGRFDEAARHLARAVELRPGEARAHYNLANALSGQGKYDRAEAAYREALRIDPDFAAAHANLGGLHESRGEHHRAVAELRNALRLQPEMASAMIRLAWILATTWHDELRDGREALQLAETAADGTRNRLLLHLDALDALAAAHAELGQFDRATNIAWDAADRAEQVGLDKSAAEMRERAELYESGQPYRKPPPEAEPKTPSAETP